jgi:putative hemolysin
MSDTNSTDKNTVSVRLATSPQEIEAAQRLRYKVFYEEYGAKPTPEMTREKRDFDKYDHVADHLIVYDEGENIVGTYRMLRRDVADQHGGFYSSGEYDLSSILSQNKSQLELGRSCVLPEFRTRPVLQLLWQGIAAYVADHNIELLFGCGSLHGTDVEKLAVPLSYLYHYHLAPTQIRARALEDSYIDMNIIPKDQINEKEAFNDLPPLMKGYLRIGATIGDGAFIDRQFNTTDVFIVMPTDFVTKRYRSHLERKTQKSIPRNTEELQDIAAFARGSA